MALIKPEQLRSGSYSITGSFSGSFYGDGSNLTGIPSASYALTSSYAVSASYEINYETSSSYAETASLAYTASYYNETDPIFTAVSGTFVLTSSFNPFTSSYYVDSGSFSTRVTNLENFSSSLDATFATDAELNAATASLSASIAYLSSSFEIFSGSYNTGSFSGSFEGNLIGTSSYSDTATSASYALTASYVENAQTASYYDETDPIFTAVSGTFVLTSSFNQFTSSYNTGSFTGSFTGDGSQLTGIVSSKWTGSNPISRESDVEITGSLSVTNGITASLYGTASWAENAITSSYSNNSTSASYALTASYIELAQTASYIENAQTASYVEIAQTASYVSASNIDGIVLSSSYALTASYVENAQTASYVLNAISSSYALSASHAESSSYAFSSSYALSSSYAFSASHAETASFSERTFQTDILVLNQSGQNIAKGVVVRITGSNNSSDIPRIVTASYENDNNSANTLGITIEAINQGSQGYVITEGILKGVNTQAFISGQLVYLGATGSIIGTAPVAPLHTVRLGEVVRHQSNNGSIYVRIDNGYELEELHDVLIVSASYGDLLVKDGNVWQNSKQLTGSYALTGSLRATSFTGSLLGTASYATIANSVNQLNQNVFISGSLTVLQGATIYGSSSFQYVTSSQLAVSSSFISVNVFEPVERFGGLKVYDSGSSNASASLAWDSFHNHWIYQNVSGSTYTGGMLLSGPRNTGSLGDEPNLTLWYVPRSDGGDHLDDSQIYSSGSTTIVTGSLTVTNGITASLYGTASWAENSQTASFVQTAQTASYIDGGFY